MLKQKTDGIMKQVFLAAAVLCVLSVLAICYFIFTGGLPAILQIGPLRFLTGLEWSPTDIPPSFGILPMIVGTIYLTLGAAALGVPIGILSAVFMARFCPKRLYAILKPMVDLLAGIPSIIYGFFGLVLIAPVISQLFGGSGKNILTASILLGIMILPTIASVSEASIRAVPESYYEGAIALGISPERAAFGVLLPAARQGISAAVVLGIGRAVGETTAVMMVAGNQPRLTDNIFKGIRTLTTNIILEMGYSEGLHRGALVGTGLVLFVLILILNTTFVLIQKKGERMLK